MTEKLLTLDMLKVTIREFRERFPEPDFWVYGVGSEPFGGPLGVSREQMARFAASGWIMREHDHYYWTPLAVNAIQWCVKAAEAQGGEQKGWGQDEPPC